MEDDDHEPVLDDEAAAVVMALVRSALGERVSDEGAVRGDVLGMVLEHASVDPENSLWLTDRAINVSLCPGCGSVFICAITSAANTIHGCVEIMEHLRQHGGLGGDPDELVCTYKRVPVMPTNGRSEYVYVFAGNYWLDFSGVDDPVFHTARSLVSVIDMISEMIDTVDAARRSLN